MKRKQLTEDQQRKKSYSETLAANDLASVPKGRLNIHVLFLGYAFGKEKSVSEYGAKMRFFVTHVPENMVGRATYGASDYKVTAGAKPGSVRFHSRPTKKNPHLPSLPVDIIPGTTMVIDVNKGAWFDGKQPGAPMLLYDVNATSGNGKNGVTAYVGAAGAELSDKFQGQPIRKFYEFDSVLKAAHEAGALTTHVPEFSDEMLNEGIYPMNNPAFLLAFGDEATDTLTTADGKPWPLTMSTIEKEHQFSFKTKEQVEKAMLGIKLWCKQEKADGTPQWFVLSAVFFGDDLEKFGLTNEHPFHVEMMKNTILPFACNMPRMVLFNVNLEKSQNMPENTDSFRMAGTSTSMFGIDEGTVETTGSSVSPIDFGYSGSAFAFFDYAKFVRSVSIRVSKEWVADYLKEAQKNLGSDPAKTAIANTVAKTAMENSGVVVMSAATTAADRILKAAEAGKNVEFFIMMPEINTVHKELGAKLIASRANELPAEDSTTLVNYLMMGSDDEAVLAESVKPMVQERMVAGMTGGNEPSTNTAVVFGIMNPDDKAPCFEMFKHVVFGAPLGAQNEAEANGDGEGGEDAA